MSDQPKVEAFVKGFETAEREFYASEAPAYDNPFVEGTEAYDGYEQAVYIFTQK